MFPRFQDFWRISLIHHLALWFATAGSPKKRVLSNSVGGFKQAPRRKSILKCHGLSKFIHLLLPPIQAMVNHSALKEPNPEIVFFKAPHLKRAGNQMFKSCLSLQISSCSLQVPSDGTMDLIACLEPGARGSTVPPGICSTF